MGAIAAAGKVVAVMEMSESREALIMQPSRTRRLISWSTPGCLHLTHRAVTEEQFHKIFNINVLVYCLPRRLRLHLGEGSSIINIGSGVSRITPPNSAVHGDEGCSMPLPVCC